MAEKKKAVLKLELRDEKAKNKAMEIVSRLRGVDSVAVDMKDKKLTAIGDINAATIANKLKRLCHSEILTVGPAVAPKVEPPKAAPNPTQPPNLAQPPNWTQPPNLAHHYYLHSVENDPNACVIC